MKNDEKKEKKEKKVKPGAQQKQSKEDIARKLAEKPRLSKEEKREAEKREKEYLQKRKMVMLENWTSRLETIEEFTERIKTEEAERLEKWERDHLLHAAEVQKQQEQNRLLPKERSHKAFLVLIKSVGWNPTTGDLDAVLEQLSSDEMAKLWIDTPLWHRARARGMIHDTSITKEFAKGCGISEKTMVHCELDASSRSSDTVVMGALNRSK